MSLLCSRFLMRVLAAPSCRNVVLRNMSANLDNEFLGAKDSVGKLKEDPGNEVKLKLYALFKQGTVGPCNTKKPGMMDFVGKAKWEAWNNLGAISQEDAKQQYIRTVQGLVASEVGAAGEKESVASATSLASGWVQTAVEGKVFNVILNRPDKKNALTVAMYEAIGEAFQQAADNPDTTVTVIKANGDYYCSGNDLGNFSSIDLSKKAEIARDSKLVLNKFVRAWIDHPKPLIALVHGPAIGVSVTTLALCDVIYASDRASFVTPFSALGQSPEGCSSFLLPRIMGLTKASEFLLFGKKLTAEEACRRNFVTEVFPTGTFDQETSQRIVQYSQLPPQSLKLSKKLIRDQLKQSLHEANESECELLEERWQSEECFNAIVQFFSRSKI